LASLTWCMISKLFVLLFIFGTLPTTFAEGTELQLAQQSFHSIYLEGCEALVASTPDGRLDLRDVYFRDGETDIFAQPEVVGELPSQPYQYTELEWASEDTGDTLMGRDGSRKVLKVYLVRVQQQEPFRLDLREVYSLDHASRVLCRETVYGLTQETDPALITLSITRDGLFIEENQDLVSEYDLVEAWWAEQEQQRVARKVLASADPGSQEAPGDEQEAPRDPIDALNDDDREYDESQEDTPSVDQGY